MGTAAPSALFDPCLLWPNGRPSQLLLSLCNCSQRICDANGNVRDLARGMLKYEGRDRKRRDLAPNNIRMPRPDWVRTSLAAVYCAIVRAGPYIRTAARGSAVAGTAAMRLRYAQWRFVEEHDGSFCGRWLVTYYNILCSKKPTSRHSCVKP